MKYRELTPNEIEAYNIGYKNGSRQAVIKVIEFESIEEKKLYRQGYNAGCQDRKRHNVSTYEIGSNVSNVSNVKSYDSAITITNANTIATANVDSRNNTSSLSTTHVKQITPPTLEEVLEYAKTQNAIAGVGGFSCPQKIATEFWMHYDSQGWVKSNDSRTPVTNWKSLLRLWTLNPNKFSKVGVAVPDDYDLPL